MTKQPQPNDAYIGRRVRTARLLKEMSQDRLGAALHITFQQVQKYETGANRIGAGRLYEIGKILEVPVTFFFEGIEEDQTAPDAPHLRPEDIKILTAYRTATPEMQAAALRVLHAG